MFILRLKNKGSKKAVNNAPVERVLKATDTLDIFIAQKKRIQCKPITAPIPSNLKIFFLVSFKEIFFMYKKIPTPINANKIRKNTSGKAEIVISLPRTPVNPHNKTKKCNLN